MMIVGSPSKTLRSKIQKEHIVVTGIINKKGKSAKFRQEANWVLKYQFVRI